MKSTIKIGNVQIVDKWSMREVAQAFYPGNISMQRKWLRAWRRAPGARVPVGKMPRTEDASGVMREVSAYCYFLNSKDRGSYAA
jgi:predicted RNA polymerase sigma factor